MRILEGYYPTPKQFYFLIDFYNQKKIKKVMKQNKIESVLPYDNKLITS
jgi:hypothetical protein